MKLLIYSHYFAPSVGGVESAVMALACGLAGSAEAGIDVTVVTATPAPPNSDAELPFRVVRRPGVGELLLLLRRSDVIHLAGPAMLPMIFALLARKPLALEHHGFQAVCPNGQFFYEPTSCACPGHFMARRHRECWRCNHQAGRWRSLRMWVLTFPRRSLCRLASANIAPTHWLAGILRLPRTTVIWHGIADPNTHAARLSASPSPPVFVYLGRLVSTKGAHLLVDAAAELRKKGLIFRIDLIGDGPERGNLEEKSRTLGVSDAIRFLGYLPEDTVEKYLQAAAAVIMPSIAGEVFGLVAAENMMRGLLVIVPKGGALAEVVGDAGIKFSSGDAAALAEAMRRVLVDPSLIALYGAQARERALSLFRRERMVAEHARLYRELAPKSRP